MKLTHIPKTSGVYRITNAITGKSYVGSAVNMRQRLAGHKSTLMAGKHHNRHLQSAFLEHGVEAFSVDVLELVSGNDLRAREQVHIDRLEVLDQSRGYNLSPRTDAVVYTDERRKLVSAAQRGRPRSEEEKMRIALARARQDPASLSHPHSQETKELLSRLARERGVSPGVGAKISAALTGRKRGPMSEETKAKIAAKAKARGALSEAHRKALSEGHKRRGARGPHTAERRLNISLAKKRANVVKRQATEARP